MAGFRLKLPYDEFATTNPTTGNVDYSGSNVPWSPVVGDVGPAPPPAPAPASAPPPGDFNFGAPPSDSSGGPYDPYVAQAQAQSQFDQSQLDTQLRQARENAIINFGDPALADMAGFGLDPQAGAFARQNYLSGTATSARLDKAHTLARQAIINKLAGHGILDSGDLGYLQGQEGQNYGNVTYDARQKVLAYLSDLYNQYLSQKQSYRNSLLDAYSQATAAMLGQ